MMYIEQTTLGDNLHNLLRNKVLSSSTSAAASILLAHVQIAEEALGNGGSANNRISAESAAVATQQLTKSNNNNSQVNKNRPILTDKKTKSLAQGKLPLTVEEDEDQYELIDVAYSANYDELRQHERVSWKELIPNQNGIQNRAADSLADNIVYQVEYEPDDDREYVIKPIQKQKQSLFRRQRGEIRQSTQRNVIPIKSRSELVGSRKRTYHESFREELLTNEEYSHEPVPKWQSLDGVRRIAQRSIRLLNGKLPPPYSRSQSRQSVSSNASSANYTYVDEKDGYFVPTDDSHHEGSVDDERKGDLTALIERRTTQMGIDIFSKLCNLLRINCPTNTNKQDAQREGKRKRRSENWTSLDAVDPHEIKYRKVHNRFPKYVTRTDEDDLQLIGTYPINQKCEEQHNAPPNWSSIDMAQRRSSNTFDEKQKIQVRKSMFTTPPMRKKLVQNTSYADVEFSDDDEPELIRGFGKCNGDDDASGSKPPRVFNIPIKRSTDEGIKPTFNLPSQRCETFAASILAASLMPERQNPRKLSYAEALRQDMPTSGGHVLGKATGQISSSSSSAIGSSRGDNGVESNPRMSSIWSTNAYTILEQNKLEAEREQYQQLLEQMMPRLYGSESSHAKSAQHNDGLLARHSAKSVGPSPTVARAAIVSPRNSLGNLTRKSLTSQAESKYSLKRAPLSSTINLIDDDDDEDGYGDADVTITGVTDLRGRRPPLKNGPIPAAVIIDDDDDDWDEISEIVDLDEACAKLRVSSATARGAIEKPQKTAKKLPYVEPVNSLQDRFNMSPHLNSNWLEQWKQKWTERKQRRDCELEQTKEEAAKRSAERRAAEVEIQERFRSFRIIDPELVILDDFPEQEEEEEEPAFIELTCEHQKLINSAICGPPDEVLVSKFNLNVTRRDIHTLLDNKWLNDEVINFYMNLLTERGENRHESDGLPRVYAMNTFFVPRLMQAGHSGVKRWTRKVDIFAKDVIPVPVHVGGIHWCMAIIHLRNRSIKYYDSMGTPNPTVLRALEQYLRDESQDKRKQPFDMDDFLIESVQGLPRQLNGSDCGVFSCMFAEYVSRDREITFSQQHMEYFRQKMIVEIVSGELLH